MENTTSGSIANQYRYFAFFDLDNTISNSTSGRALAIAAYRKRLMSPGALLRAFWLSVTYRLNLKDHLQIISNMMSWVRGIPEETMNELCKEVFRDKLLNSIFSEAKEEIGVHKSSNAKVVILSSSLYPICSEVARNLGIDDVICSHLEVSNGILTGNPIGNVCIGEEKALRMRDYCEKNNTRLSDAWYYGDAFSDLSALSIAGNPVCVNPDKKLRKAAAERGWKIVSWRAN
jgi:putative phosphoserine phosphatase / 1-acylglycerol-3-phosphate O-acyltransferase